VEQEIVQTKAAIAAESLSPVRDETTDHDVNYAWAKAELQKARVELKGLAARGATTSVHLAQYRTLARQLGEEAITQDDLMSAEKAADENYLLYMKKREVARMGDALDEGASSMWQSPSSQLCQLCQCGLPHGGNRGLVAALMAGHCAAFAADYLDPALRTPEEVMACLEVPVLASLPIEIDRRMSA